MTRICLDGGPRHGESTSLDHETATAGTVLVVDEVTGLPVARYVRTHEVRTIGGVPHLVWRYDESRPESPGNEAAREVQHQALAETISLGGEPDEDPQRAARLLAEARAEIARRRDR